MKNRLSLLILLIGPYFRPTRMSEPAAVNQKPAELTVTSLKAMLEKAQTVAEADTSSSPWQKNIIKQSKSVNESLQQLLTMLKLSRIQFLSETLEDRSDFSVSRWLRLIVVMSLSASNPVSEDVVKTEAIKSKIVEQFSQLRGNVIEAIKLFKEFHNISTKVNKLHQTYKKNTINIIKTPTSIIPIAEVPLNHTSQEDAACVSDHTDAISTIKNSSTGVLTIIKHKILFEYVDEKCKVFRTTLPTLDRCDDILVLSALISNLDSLISNCKNGIPFTAESIRKITPEIEDSISCLVTVLEKHNRKDRIRSSVCSIDTKRQLAMIESTFQILSGVMSEIPSNLKRVVGVSDYFSPRFCPSNLDPTLNVCLQDSQPRRRLWWPFNTSKVKRFKDDAQLEAEEFMKKVINAENICEFTYQLHLPVTPELAAIIVRRALTSEVNPIEASEVPAFGGTEADESSKLNFVEPCQDQDDVVERLLIESQRNVKKIQDSASSDNLRQKDQDYGNSDFRNQT